MLRGRRTQRAVEQLLEEVEGLQKLERPLLEPGSYVAGGSLRDDGLQVVVGESLAPRAGVLRESGCARRRTDAEPFGVCRVDNADFEADPGRRR